MMNRETANSLLQQMKDAPGGFTFISDQLKTATIIRKREKKKKKINAADKNQLSRLYYAMFSLPRLSDRNVFRECVPEQEIAAWFAHVADVLQQKIHDPHWIRTGMLLKHDELLLNSYSAFLCQPLPAVMTFENTKILEIISSMITSRKLGSDKFPAQCFVGELIVLIFTLMNSANMYFDNTWEPEKVFKKLEPIGLLEHLLRFAATQSEASHVIQFKHIIFQQLLRSTKLVKKRLKEGTPCGDTLRAILEGTDGPTPICSFVLPYYQSLVQLSTLLQIEEEVDCQCCKKRSLKNTYMHCGRCKQVHYCSKECQKADWKEHKTGCFEATNAVVNDFPRLSSSVISGILKVCYVEIMFRLVEECDKAGGLTMKDMILELDLSPDHRGRIPLLQDPPQFEITPIARYLDSSRPRELQLARGWVEDVDVEERNEKVEQMVTTLTEKLSRSTDSGLLGFELHPAAKVYKSHQLFTEGQERPMFTQEAVDAFRIAMVDDDYSHLLAIFESQELVDLYKIEIHLFRHVRA